ncbi:MAG: D-glycero-beta-D-manno-heptose 1-phosphate adenylyltransferase [Nitrospirota bacterium]|nr:MAG: D-glycero-beta-D-manno-heptose 1-phosphate adenylyltransferase [Nitrospirota bacterium]
MGNIAGVDKAKSMIEGLKRDGKRVVFTNGCFDIIHAGHIRYLKEASKLGDVLVVGLNSDSSVKGIKDGRPVVPQEERAEVLSALDMVDLVVIFNEETPYELIKTLGPDVLVKGGDWSRKDIIGSDIVKEVHSLKYYEGMSTTGIIDKIRSLKS